MSSKALTENDVNERFTVPVKWLDQYWPNIVNNRKIPLKVVHQVTLAKEIWYDFVLSTRGEDQKNAVFDLKGWSKFVKANDLRKNDVVYFGKKGGEDHYTIMVERKYV
ncbi:hypothetical protein TIFTF001_018714 [Ficus carica]|uniref:TF-B3 domain-containing protein n=1 Tax=Ficus carica TaxID=3494 RepID=A0AA88AAB1_FICCA|nr:hypothetical protein TIFTF001_018714 [Ficus carica]